MVGQGKTIICLVGFKAMNRPINKQCDMNSLSVLIEYFASVMCKLSSRNVQLKRLEKWTDPFSYGNSRNFYIFGK
ncbi:Uncharacterized protein BM_BM1349 [Brugia malayi]|uniref:Bm1349 n=1 Tax=Brugia malayi TaxID=6279 RepID=A0A4E9FP33_BRUMA|nr:Uncharacterized protein BM_BM1349 [Brugia malayi]VIO98226.1 Uncharacterized protein BM_BM1349 [Brugia malayi]